MQESEEFMSSAEFVDMMLGQVHPVILSNEQHSEHFSHHGVGTAFVLEYAGELFVVTAQHVLNNQRAGHDELRILLRNAPLSVLFDQHAVFRDESEPDLDSDLVILRVVKSQHAALFAAGLASLDAACCAETEDFGRADLFHVFGYPDEGRGYDYDHRVLDSQLHWLRGQLIAPGIPGLSTIKIVDDRPDDFRGMSGSVVIADVDGVWRFAGMVTLASERNDLLNFIPAEKIAYNLNEMILMDRVRLKKRGHHRP
ncbi:serine protease [Pseudomonas fragi]|uniref:serine protease n=1 Tax=Pseudomonas fragi TaxID=296 RepID=UPI0021CC5186|nr:serine protease [Pseudomonas fragi]